MAGVGATTVYDNRVEFIQLLLFGSSFPPGLTGVMATTTVRGHVQLQRKLELTCVLCEDVYSC